MVYKRLGNFITKLAKQYINISKFDANFNI